MRALRLLALLALTSVLAHAAAQGSVTGTGLLDASSSICAIPSGPAPAHLRMTMNGSVADWDVTFTGGPTAGCPVVAVTTCSGHGRLADGVTFDGCTAGATGSLTSVVACSPGPAQPMLVQGSGAVHVANLLGSYDGRLPLTFDGDARSEAPNLCV